MQEEFDHRFVAGGNGQLGNTFQGGGDETHFQSSHHRIIAKKISNFKKIIGERERERELLWRKSSISSPRIWSWRPSKVVMRRTRQFGKCLKDEECRSLSSVVANFFQRERERERENFMEEEFDQFKYWRERERERERSSQILFKFWNFQILERERERENNYGGRVRSVRREYGHGDLPRR